MIDDEPTQSDLDDAIIEDTVHCDLCAASWLLGGNADGIIVTLPGQYEGFGHKLGGQLKLCIDCAAFVSRTFEQACHERDICEHGIVCGEWCGPCNRAYKEAIETNDSGSR